jgi:HD-GYP domain-containing protein (c-di-GMP phosphodiesterase class II)
MNVLYCEDLLDVLTGAWQNRPGEENTDLFILFSRECGYETGARPFSPDELERTAFFFARLIDSRTSQAGHSQRVARKAIEAGTALHYRADHTAALTLAGALHDIGKLKIPEEILFKPAPLTDDEIGIMKTHAAYTFEMLSGVRGLEKIGPTAWCHHEKLDGSGYPQHLAAADLTPDERLLACIDIYEALTEERCYKKAYPHEITVGMMKAMAFEGRIDEKFVQLLDALGS